MTAAEIVPAPAPEMAVTTGHRFSLLIAMSTFADEELPELRSSRNDVHELAEVLRDPAIGDYEVAILVDAGLMDVLKTVDEFFSDRLPDDLLLVYVSTHGMLDVRGELYFAVTDTRRDRLASTAMSAGFLRDRMESCRARGQILLLDASYSGRFK